MIFEIIYHVDVVKDDIQKLDFSVKRKIKKAIDEKLSENPNIFGKPLRRSIKGYRKLRVGNYRIIFRIYKKQVKIFAIQHRSVIYKNIEKRVV